MAIFNDHGPGFAPEGPVQTYGEAPKLSSRSAEADRKRALYLSTNEAQSAAIHAGRLNTELNMLRLNECSAAEISELSRLAYKCQSAIATARRRLVGLPLTASEAEVDARCAEIRARAANAREAV